MKVSIIIIFFCIDKIPVENKNALYNILIFYPIVADEWALTGNRAGIYLNFLLQTPTFVNIYIYIHIYLYI